MTNVAIPIVLTLTPTIRKPLQVLSALLCVLLGLVFLYSGYTKLLPVIETFEFSFVDLGIAGWYSAPVIARLLIGAEFFLGLMLIMNFRLRSFTLPFAIGLLSVFVIYLAGQIILHGNKGNCGCFGEHHNMTPAEGIIKNLFMIGGCVFIRYTYKGWSTKLQGFVTWLVLITSAGLPFIVNPIDYAYTSNNLDERVNYPLELELLYSPEDSTKVEIPKTELRKGKHVLAFLSLTCSHCRVAAKKMGLIRKKNPEIPIYFVLNGERADFDEFIEDTRAGNIPYSFCLGKSFVRLSSARLPRIYYLSEGVVVKKVDHYELNQHDIEKWLQAE